MQVPNATADIAAARFKVHAGPGGDLSSIASDSASAASSAASSSSSTVESSAPAGLAWAQESTNGKNPEIKFINQSGHSIYHIYAWTTDQSESDGHDLMGPEMILTGQTRTYKVDDGQNHCDYSFKATRADSASPIYVSNIRVCGAEQVVIAESSVP